MNITIINKRYRLDAEIGRGGLGTIYRAHDLLLDRPVAVKVLSSNGVGTEGRARLLHEARSAARLNHPNIVKMLAAVQEHDQHYLIMEYMPAGSLADRLPRPALLGQPRFYRFGDRQADRP